MLSLRVMGQEFFFHFSEGLTHITDINGYDHIVFLIALCAVYDFTQWKRVLLLVTAFTVGHSLTLFCAGMDWVVIPSHVAEFLIPCTILITGLYNLRGVRDREHSRKRSTSSGRIKYFLALFFGLIHGFGFSNYFRMIRADESESFVMDLLYFNLGVEAGQILIVLALLLIASFAMSLFKFKQNAWNLFSSGIAVGISIILIIDTWIF